MENTRYYSLKILTTCNDCGSPVVVNGPLLKVVCNACQNEMEYTPEMWSSLVITIDKKGYHGADSHEENLTFSHETHSLKITHGKVDPQCQNCQTPLPLEKQIASAQSVHCESCGQSYILSDAPSWFEHAGTMKFIGAELESSHTEKSIEALRPISMNCPNCAAPLKITQKLKRVTTCDYCQGEFYIPDVIWRKLHPVSVAKDWYVQLTGKPDWLIEKERARQEQEERGRLQREKLEERLAVEQELNRFSKARGIMGHVIALLAGIFLIGFPVLFIPPLSEAVGSAICDGQFSVHTSSRGDGATYISFDCTKNGKRESVDGEMFLFGPVAGAIVLMVLWAIYRFFFKLINRKKIQQLEMRLDKISE